MTEAAYAGLPLDGPDARDEEFEASRQEMAWKEALQRIKSETADSSSADEIEITPEMKKAGAEAIYADRWWHESPGEWIAERVYIAMERARHQRYSSPAKPEAE